MRQKDAARAGWHRHRGLAGLTAQALVLVLRALRAGRCPLPGCRPDATLHQPASEAFSEEAVSFLVGKKGLT